LGHERLVADDLFRWTQMQQNRKLSWGARLGVRESGGQEKVNSRNDWLRSSGRRIGVLFSPAETLESATGLPGKRTGRRSSARRYTGCNRALMRHADRFCSGMDQFRLQSGSTRAIGDFPAHLFRALPCNWGRGSSASAHARVDA
jgi:hypothetical protein